MKLISWEDDFRNYLKGLQESKPDIHQEIMGSDHWPVELVL